MHKKSHVQKSGLGRTHKQKSTVLKHCRKAIFCASHLPEMEMLLGWSWMQEDPVFYSSTICP